MSYATMILTGRIARDPETRETRNGNSMATAPVPLSKGRDEPTEWFRLVAFGAAADQLAQHKKGDEVVVSGRLEVDQYTGRDGETRKTLQIIVETLLSARAQREKLQAATATTEELPF